MLTSISRFATHCKSILPFFGAVRCSRNVLASWKSTLCLNTTTVAEATSREGCNALSWVQNQRARSFFVRGLTSQATAHGDGSAKPLVNEAKICKSSRMLLLEWNDGTVSRYPFVWLRDNCRCMSCWHHDAYGRISLIEDLDVDIKPTGVTLSDGGVKVYIHWPDNHTSPFETSLLKDVTFKEETPKKKTRMWGHELRDEMPTFQFDSVMSDDSELLQFLEALRDVGLTLLKGAPAETGNIAKLAERISYLKLTSYGHVHTVKSKAGANSLAYTGHKLSLHTDLPHFDYTPNLSVFHCIKQCGGTTGGESMFADGFKTALQLKDEDPEAFQILCDTSCDFIEKGVDMVEYHTKCSWPIFSFDRNGDIAKVHHSNMLRDTRLRMPIEKVYPYYKAVKTYDNLIHREENMVSFRMQPGDMVMFENTRVLHGRKAFEVTEDAVRHLETAYLDWDGVYSKIRCLRERLRMSFNEY